MIRAKFLKGSQFIFLLEQTMLNRKSQSCAFPHLDSRFALSGKKSPANASAFGKSNSRLCAAAMSQPRGAEGKRGRGALLRVPAAPHGEKGLAFLPFPPAEGIPGAGWERNPDPCWNGEGEEAHSFTALWAGLLLALTHWATCFSSVCWPEGFIFSLVLVSAGCAAENYTWDDLLCTRLMRVTSSAPLSFVSLQCPAGLSCTAWKYSLYITRIIPRVRHPSHDAQRI